MIDDSSTLPVPLAPARVSLVAQLADIPEDNFIKEVYTA